MMVVLADIDQCMLVPVLWLMFVVCWSMYVGTCSTGGYWSMLVNVCWYCSGTGGY
jgi:hypothetical protein